MKNRLKFLRAEPEWTEARLARQLGVSRRTVRAIETGAYGPSVPLAVKIANLFGRSIEEIFTTERKARNENQQ